MPGRRTTYRASRWQDVHSHPRHKLSGSRSCRTTSFVHSDRGQTFHCRLRGRMNTYSTTPALIAPCGINCRLCRAHGREKKACPGCRGEDTFKSKSCITCRIRNCEKLVQAGFEYCFDCDAFPCARLSHLDKRYRTKYGASPIGNLSSIKEIGIINFLRNEEQKWTCPACGSLICMHKPQCLACGYVWHK